MEAILVVALILSNGLWLVFLDRKDDRSADERRELLNRIAEPEMVVPPKEVIKRNIELAKSPDTQEFDIPELYEHAGVGQIDPDLMRGDKADG